MIRLNAAPVYSIEISDDECTQAQSTREEFEKMVELQDMAFEHLDILSGALQGVSDSQTFASMKKLFVQYQRKLKRLFNDFIVQLEKALNALNDTVSDSEMKSIRDVIVGEIREIRDGIIEILEVLERPEENDFVKNFIAASQRLGDRSESLKEVITDQLYDHIDSDILSEVRLG